MFELGDQMKPTLTLFDDTTLDSQSTLNEYKAKSLMQSPMTLAFTSFPLPITKQQIEEITALKTGEE